MDKSSISFFKLTPDPIKPGGQGVKGQHGGGTRDGPDPVNALGMLAGTWHFIVIKCEGGI